MCHTKKVGIGTHRTTFQEIGDISSPISSPAKKMLISTSNCTIVSKENKSRRTLTQTEVRSIMYSTDWLRILHFNL